MSRRRAFLKLLARTAVLGSVPWPAISSATPQAVKPAATPRYFTAKEMVTLRAVTTEVLPAPDVVNGTVDVASNLDLYLSRFPRYDLGLIRKGLRMLNAELTYVLARVLGQATALDRTAVSKYLVTLGYYGEGNGEADQPPPSRRIWPRLGYPGPLGPGFPGYKPAGTPLPERALPDRLGGLDPLAYLTKSGILA